MSPIRIDAIDAAIIDLLQGDGRMPATEIAKRVPGATPRLVRYRIERLVREGIITVTAVVQPKGLGYTIMADILIEVEPDRTSEIVHLLAGMDLVTYASGSTGDRDISIQVVASSIDELYDFTLNTVRKIPGVLHSRTYLLPLAAKFTYSWKLPREAISHGSGEA